MIRDSRRDATYFNKLLIDLDIALQETQQALDDEVFTSISLQVDAAQQLFQLSIMRAVAHYSAGSEIPTIKTAVLAILDYRRQLSSTADKLPPAHQCYRYDFEKLGEWGDACGSANVNRYVYVLWWLTLLTACDVEQSHIDSVLGLVCVDENDALLARITSKLGRVNTAFPDNLYYPETYQSLYDAITASPLEQSALLGKFINEWYDSLEEADWYESHDCDCEFVYTDYYIGYWCFEAALIINLFNIPNTLVEHELYPKDLVFNYNIKY
ncbi:PoNe immunity protein domain-containing protein [uncultured Psychromonas sp.]|uniref:PoNe immunity protein domain-containing protein n=1 Tax=uncultured Psychromonas sp. TaxID=173974 RepID=UPI00262D51A5|nr:PoNe immunity protein domain-containing protein [uncultured Psychromonas sp.]